MNDRLAAIVAARKENTSELAKTIGVDRTHLIDVCSGRSRPGDDFLKRVESSLGVSPGWAKGADVPIFTRSPGKAVEDTIEAQMKIGPTQTAPVPVFDDITDAEASDDALPRWRTRPVRGLVPLAAAKRSGFYVHVNDKETASVIGCRSGDHVLFVDASAFIRRSRIREGDMVSAIVSTGSTRHLMWLSLVQVVTRQERTAGVGFAPASGGLSLRGVDSADYCFRRVDEKAIRKGSALLAIAAKAERDLLIRGNDACDGGK